jgi:hypothetical protein
MLTIIYILLGTILTDSTPSYEQLTADYFFKTIWKEKYQDYKSIEFENKTDTTIYVGHVYGCKDWTEEDKKEIRNGKTIKEIVLDCKPTDISIKRKSNSKRLKLLIGTKIQLGDTFVVQLTVYKPLEFVDHYFIKLDRDGNIIDRCEFNEMI